MPQGFYVFIAIDGTTKTNVNCALTCVFGNNSIGKCLTLFFDFDFLFFQNICLDNQRDQGFFINLQQQHLIIPLTAKFLQLITQLLRYVVGWKGSVSF